MENKLQATDLRIGNLVTDEWGISTYIVESINENGINLYIEDDGNWSEIADQWIAPYYKFESIRGIPLSEDWLLKLGFEETYRSEFTIKLQLNEAQEVEFKWNQNFGWNFYYKGQMISNINFIHQIQNLTFALTEIELTIKE